ncbi:hypothetical protein ASD21_15015 [Caulobacter sp. Root1455]|nr:hypothetical protein ASD21_15015 [Caulobacter sp. Root1455]
MTWAGGSRISNMLPLPPEGPLPSLNTVLKATPENPSGDPHGHVHQAGGTAGKVVGGGLGVVVVLGVLLLMFGPMLWAPVAAALSAAVRVKALTHNGWASAGAAIAAGLAVAFVQFLLLVQKSPLLRYPAVLLFSLAWVGGLWLELAAPPHNWLTAPPWHAPGPWAMAAVGVGTVIYAGLYLLILARFGKGPWASRWQLIK